MAGHSQFANIKHRKNAQDAKRAKLFTKIQRQIFVAAKSGLTDPELNSRLKSAIAIGKSVNLPKDRIEYAIKKATDSSNENYEEIRYNGYINGVALIVETLTDNKNRTANNIRSIFTKCGGSLGETGSVEFMFEHVGSILCDGNDEKLFDIAVKANAKDMEQEGEKCIIFTAIEDLHKIISQIENNVKIEESSIIWRSTIYADEKTEDEKILINKAISLLEDDDDVQCVYHNMLS